MQVFPTEVVVLIRDHDNHMYKTWIFYFSKFFAEVRILFSVSRCVRVCVCLCVCVRACV